MSVAEKAVLLVDPTGFEPVTSSMPWRRSSQLSYGPQQMPKWHLLHMLITTYAQKPSRLIENTSNHWLRQENIPQQPRWRIRYTSKRPHGITHIIEPHWFVYVGNRLTS